MPIAFGAAGVGGFAAMRVEPESRASLIVCGALFCTISMLGFLWPILRIRETQGVSLTSVLLRHAKLTGILLPTSRVKPCIALVGASVFGVFGILAAFFADSMEHRVKGGLAGVCYIGFIGFWFWGSLGKQKGIFLSQQGLLWQETFLAPCFIPWEQILAANRYAHPSKHSSTPSLGIRLQNIEALDVDGRTRKKLIENFNRYGWHLYYHAESLLISLEAAERSIGFYFWNPTARQELATDVAKIRIHDFDRNDLMDVGRFLKSFSSNKTKSP